MTTVFVTGSGTELGKTFVCCQLINVLRERYRVRAIKPVATGFDSSELSSSDTGRLLEAQGLPLDRRHIDATTPWRFGASLSPDMAADREGGRISFSELVAFSASSAEFDLTVIEGIGGVMVPLDSRHTVLDWIAALGARVLLVAGSYLGTLSHTLTARAALREREVDMRAAIVSESTDGAVDLGATVEVLGRWFEPVPVYSLPRQAAIERVPTELVAPWVRALGL